MEVDADAEGLQSTEADFDRVQDELDDVGSKLAMLKQQAEHLLDAALSNRTATPSLENQ